MKNDQSKKILVTGGAGFIGSHLVDAWLEDGHRVTVVDDFSTGLEENLPSVEAQGGRFSLHRMDIGSPQAAQLLAEGGFDVLVHEAAQMNIRRSVEDVAFDARVNILGTVNLLEAAARGGVKQILFASTGGAIYGEQEMFPATESHPLHPVSPYGVSKVACEHYLYYFHQAYGLDVTCLRYGNVYGPRQNPLGEAGVVAIFLKLLLDGKTPTINGDGGQTRDYIHVDDVVDANRAALGRPGFHIYNVGAGIETSVVELYQHLATAVGTSIEASFGPAKPGEQRRSCIDPSLGRKELSLGEAIPLQEGLQRTTDWVRRRQSQGLR